MRLMLLAAALSLNVAAQPIAVDVYTGGDDGLTERLADQVRAAMKSNSGSSDKIPPTRLIVKIPNHVSWRQVGDRTKIGYAVELTLGLKTKRRSGSCWENQMSACANQIAHAAKSLE